MYFTPCSAGLALDEAAGVRSTDEADAPESAGWATSGGAARPPPRPLITCAQVGGRTPPAASSAMRSPGQRRLVRCLEYDGVAGDQRCRDLAGREEERVG